MERIVNYLDMSVDEKNVLFDSLFMIGFRPAIGNKKTMQKEMDKSKPHCLPQYLFVFRDTELIGYMFLMGEQEGISKAFPWWAVDNADEIPLKSAVELLEIGITMCDEFGCFTLAERLRKTLVNQKQGIGRRVEKDCR